MTTAEEQSYNEVRDAEIGQGLRQLVQISGQNSRDHGFHDDWPVEGYPTVTKTGEPASYVPAEQIAEHQTQLRRAIAEKLALVHEEVSEMLGEIRSGRDPLEIYYVDTKGRIGEKGAEYAEQDYAMDGFTPLLKPEGFLVEAADAIIRLADLTFLVDGAEVLVEAQRVKHLYNATRPYKHGRKF